MNTLLIIYLSGFIFSFLLGIYMTLMDSENYKDLIRGLFCTIVGSCFSWLFIIAVLISYKQEIIDKFLNKQLPWRKKQ